MDITVGFSILAVVIIILIILFKYMQKSELETKIKELTDIYNNLNLEITEKEKLLNNIDKQIDPYDHKEMNLKIDFILNSLNNNEKGNNTGIIVLLIILATALIIYCLYRFTYYIQPDNLISSLNNTFSRYLQ
ncbi:MAG: hypothetical protein K0Q49_2389 [Haloplasmataceae bacterium]|jgi:t-SNARE complex subunit (syntaxin)|nr:hypothetical protein [Haloplasmataceae bacterium]